MPMYLIEEGEKVEKTKTEVQIGKLDIRLKDRNTEGKKYAKEKEWEPDNREGTKEGQWDQQAHNALIILYWEQG